MTTKPKAQAIRRDAVDSGSIGYLEVFHNHSWYAVCADGMNVNIAIVLCTQLGYDGAFAVADLGMKTPSSDVKQLRLGNLTCSGMEKTTSDCTHTSGWKTGPCNGRRVAALMCRGQ